MNVKELDKKEIETIYKGRLLTDFPENEVKPFALTEAFIKDGCYKGYGYFDGEELLAYAFFLIIDKTALLDHIAVTGARRNAGIGGLFLRELTQNTFKEYRIVAEVENPEYASNEEDKNLMERRIGFYLRNGWRISRENVKLYYTNYNLISIGTASSATDADVLDIYRKYIVYLKNTAARMAPQMMNDWEKGLDLRLLGWVREE